MGGKRIAEHVRRALMVAAKTATVVVAIDARGCGDAHIDTCSCNPECALSPRGGTDASWPAEARAIDAGTDRTGANVTDAGTDGG